MIQVSGNRAHVIGLLAIASLALFSQPVLSQLAYDSPNGRVEILGLRRWNLQMLKDSVHSRRPGTELHDAACMIVLREDLGFADAWVSELHFVSAPGAPLRTYLVIKLVEPGDRARVQWRSAVLDTLKVLRPGYAPVILAITDSLGNLELDRLLSPLQSYNRRTTGSGALAPASGPIRPDIERLWYFLDGKRADRDWREALLALRTDGAYPNRIVAAAILSNFSANDSTWWALANALRDPHEAVRIAAAVTLRGLSPRKVDWQPVSQSLRLLLGGTNVGATQQILAMLAQTEVAPALATTLLRGNGGWVLAHLRAEYPGASESARAFLIRLNGGHDLGSDKARWARWIAAL